MVTLLSLCAVFRFLQRAGCAAVALLLAAPAFGDVVYTGSSVVFSGSNTAGLSARATFTVDPMDSNVLRLLLENTTSGTTMAPSELLTSVYFNVNVLSGTLAYKSASGYVFQAQADTDDLAVKYTPPTPPSTTGSVSSSLPVPPSNLKAVNRGDNTWQFRDVFSLVASVPPLKFGVGTVGNSALNPNGFQGNIVDGFDFGIYTGDVGTQNLDGTLLVKDSAVFEFSGFGNSNLSQVSPHVVFGFGSSPDSIITVPEPDTLSLGAFGLIAALVTVTQTPWRRLFARRRGDRPRSAPARSQGRS